MQGFSFSIPTRSFFGPEEADNFIKSVAKIGKKCLLLTGKNSASKFGYSEIISTMLNDAGITPIHNSGIENNPDPKHLKEILKEIKSDKPDFIIGLGGGATMNAAKALAILVAMNEEDIWQYCEGQSRAGRVSSAIPVVTIPTLAGSGSELSPISIISNKEQRRNEQIYSHHIRPVISWLNPTFTITSPSEVTKSGAINIIGHVVESYLTDDLHSSPLTDLITEGIVKTVIKNLPLVIDNPDDYNSRANLLLASSLSLSELEKMGRSSHSVNLLHKIENTLTGFYPDISQGLGITILLPLYLKWLSKREEFAPRVEQLINNVFDTPGAKLADCLLTFNRWLENNGLYNDLKSQGVEKGSLPAIATDIVTYSNINIGNRKRIKLIEEDIVDILTPGL